MEYPKIPSGVTKIADGAFSGSSIRTITLGKNISYLGQEAFQDCVNLTSIKFSEKSRIQILHHRTFENCRFLKKLELPDSVKEMKVVLCQEKVQIKRELFS